MEESKATTRTTIIDQVVDLVLRLPWLNLAADLYGLALRLWQGLTDQGMYEVLEYESTLELLDKYGKRARFRKREKVRYRQNNIMTYQDQGWADGESLLNYRCTPGVVVDRYRPGQKTYILISLRESKQRGEVDEFHIEWSLRDAFLREQEQWETEVSHRTRYLHVRLVFPKTRPPIRIWMGEYLRRRMRLLGDSALRQLPNGRWQVEWQTNHPRLHERYVLKWEW